MIAIIGSGNVASHMYNAFRKKASVCMVNPHTLEGMPENPELILICVKDDVIEEVVDKLPYSSSIIAHTAGSVPMDILSKKTDRFGVFYPLQTFNKDIPLDYSIIPVFIEGNSAETVEKLKSYASIFTENVREADSNARKQLHLASVFACNFNNALAGVADYLLKNTDIPFSVLLPLMQQTLNKLENHTPQEAQTGPAIRGDMGVINQHLSMLESDTSLKDIYKLISKLINPDLNEI